MIAYIRCTCTARDKQIVSKLQDLGYEVRDIRKNKHWRAEARAYDVPLPFLVKDGQPARIVL